MGGLCHINFVYAPASCQGHQPVRIYLYKRHRFPAEIISHCVWFYHRFDMSFRAVEELLFERGVVLRYEAVRRWCLKFGSEYARRLKRRRARLGDKWHLDEVGVPEYRRGTSLPVASG
uniref:Mobile element protein n=1 Tax=uncultured Truepera sp. TaxID=543023 RepID=A0A6J4VPZ1_9DEIN|nr:MAG: hypothetical protein AVDCRST_MAG86-3367 [uncultured Truepera sp.]